MHSIPLASLTYLSPSEVKGDTSWMFHLFQVPAFHFVLLLLLTALQSLSLIDQNPCIPIILSLVFIRTNLYNHYDFNIIEICFFLTILAAKT